MMENDHSRQTIHPPPRDEKLKREANSIEFDFERYAEFLSGSDLTCEQQLEHMQAVWGIMTEFVMLGFGVHPVQHPCGKVENNSGKPTRDSGNALDSMSSSLVSKFDASTRELEHSQIGGDDV